MRKIGSLVLSFLALLALSISGNATARPKLAVLIVVDQMRADYLIDQQLLYTGGFKRLMTSGFQFTGAYHAHAVTETGVGHATIATGCYPSHHGIVANDWWDAGRDRWLYCVEDPTGAITGYPGMPGRSPDNLKRQTLGDWLRRESPQSKVFSISGIDRAAILMGGLGPNGVYWYNKDDGKMITALCYTPIYPDWVKAFNDERPADHYFMGVWDRLRPDSDYSGPDSVAAEDHGDHSTFPHNFAPAPNDPPSKYYSELLYTPYADQLLLNFARELVTNEKLGSDSVVDLLAISCSAGDYVGHRYGPSSQEIQDLYYRLDGYLGSFFAFLDSTVGANDYVVALTGDHGVMPLPEELRGQKVDAGRFNNDTLEAAIKLKGRELADEMKCKDNVILQVGGGGVYLLYHQARELNFTDEWLRNAVALNLKRLPFVEDAVTPEELSATDPYSRPFFSLYRNNYCIDRSPDVMLRFKQNWIISDQPYGTTHGSPYGYDTHVPMIFYGPGIVAGTNRQSLPTIDIAPTISALIGISVPSNVDGASLAKFLSH